MESQEIKLGITGHRPRSIVGMDYDLTSPLVRVIKVKLIDIVTGFEPTQLICGMALGIDTLFALIAMELDIPLIAAIPFPGQEKLWPPKHQRLYHKILNWHKTEKVIVSPGLYSPQKMSVRNKYIVDKCNVLIAVYNGTPGGTRNCLRYARAIKRIVIELNPSF